MIEIVSAAACIACDVCVKVCPTDVFDRGADGVPVIARQSDCQTCFMCEAYCPTDALYVAPSRHRWRRTARTQTKTPSPARGCSAATAR